MKYVYALFFRAVDIFADLCNDSPNERQIKKDNVVYMKKGRFS